MKYLMKSYKKMNDSVAELNKIREILERGKLASGKYEIYDFSEELNQANDFLLQEIPINIGKNSWKGVLLPDEIAISMGGKDIPSVYGLFITQRESTELTEEDCGVHNGRITLIGPDIQELKQNVIPFGLVFFIDLQPEDKDASDSIHEIKKQMYISDEIQGFQYRALLNKNWFRLGKNYIEDRLSFLHIALAYIYLFRRRMSKAIESIEVFIIADNENLIRDLKPYEEIAERVYLTGIKEKIESYKKKRIDCDFAWGCEICEYQNVCEGIKDLIKIRRDLKQNG